MRPWSITTMTSACWIVDSRWAMQRVVRSAHQLVQRGLHEAFGLGVQRAGGFIEHQDGGVSQDGAGDGDALALAAGQRHPFFADLRVIALGPFHDEVVGVSMFRGHHDLRFGRAGPAQRDVVPDRIIEQDDVLGDHRDLVAQVAGWPPGEYPRRQSAPRRLGDHRIATAGS